MNIIMRRYELGGALPPAPPPVYADVSGVDFDQAQLVVAAAKSRFFSLPARVRDRFDNDPGSFLDFMDDPRNVQEAQELGLLRAPAPTATPAAPAAPAASTPAAGPANSST